MNTKPRCYEANPDRHFFLYAKNWYKQSDNTLKDLKQIMAHRCGYIPELASQRDIEIVLLELVHPILYKRGERRAFQDFQSFISRVTLEKRPVYDACLSFLALTERKEFPFDLGTPDPHILPIA